MKQTVPFTPILVLSLGQFKSLAIYLELLYSEINVVILITKTPSFTSCIYRFTSQILHSWIWEKYQQYNFFKYRKSYRRKVINFPQRNWKIPGSFLNIEWRVARESFCLLGCLSHIRGSHDAVAAMLTAGYCQSAPVGALLVRSTAVALFGTIILSGI
jgi:hypothetical protein